jgi:hypothetical protein
MLRTRLRKSETYTDLACGFRIGTSTVYRYVREALTLLAAMTPTLEQAIEVASRKAFVILDGTLQTAPTSAAPAAARLAQDPAALARPAGRPPMDLPATTTGPTAHRPTHPGAGAAAGPGEPHLGLPPRAP